jgi:hypothetical protein
MNTSILKLSIVSSPKTKFSDEQFLLEEFTGKKFSRNEAESAWANVLNHKWNMSEKLGRDVGFRVATIDYIENIYEPKINVQKTTGRKIKMPKFIGNIIRSYFESKANLTY